MKKIEVNFLLLGGTCDSFSSYLCLRSIRTFNIRMKVHNENAKQLVALIENHPAIRYINYPSAEGYGQKELAQKLLGNNYGAMLSIRVKDDKELVDKFVKELKLVKYLGTLGGYRTSFAHPATAFRAEFTQEELEKMGMYEGLLRFSVGLEDIRDIAEDVNNALNVFL
jgi:cystathionine beta-lyase/cystathionine gamma-synthase